MAQWLRALTALPEVLSSILSNHMVAHNHLQWHPMPSSDVSEDSYSVLTYIIKINKSFLKKEFKNRLKLKLQGQFYYYLKEKPHSKHAVNLGSCPK